MRATRPFLGLLGAVIFMLVAPDGSARADGDQFFEPQEIPGEPIFVVFGSVKDDGGNHLANALVTIEVAKPVLIYDTTTNLLGRFRTVDVGREIIALGYDVDPTQIEVVVSVPGYDLLRRFNRNSPRRQQGAVEIDFVMRRQE